MLGQEFLKRVEGRGLLTKSWVEEDEVLRHPAVGLFVSHSLWNSVIEAARTGVPMLAWWRVVVPACALSGGDGKARRQWWLRKGLLRR